MKSLETQVKVSRQFVKSGRDVGLAVEQDESLDIHAFATEPAKVTVEMGMTINLGNYESARVAVTLTVPCYLEEHETAYEYARKFVEKRVLQEAEEAKRFAQNRAKGSF